MVFGVSDRSDINWSVNSQEKARSLKFVTYDEEKCYYPRSENKGANQLCSYCTADLRLCFCIGNNPVFSRCGSLATTSYLLHKDSLYYSCKLILYLVLFSYLRFIAFKKYKLLCYVTKLKKWHVQPSKVYAQLEQFPCQISKLLGYAQSCWALRKGCSNCVDVKPGLSLQ